MPAYNGLPRRVSDHEPRSRSHETSHGGKSDEELYDVLYGHAADYTADAVEIAKQEFNARHLDAPALANLATGVEQKAALDEAPLGWPLRVVAFFTSTMFFFIPLMLAHRHYVECGARRKARDWARWAWLGFAFYVLAGISIRVLSEISN